MGFWPTTPDIAVEVVSPRDRASEVRQKVDEYLEAGIGLVWVVYPDQRQVDVYEPGKHVVPLTADDTLSGGELLPGFKIVVSSYFRTLDPHQAANCADLLDSYQT